MKVMEVMEFLNFLERENVEGSEMMEVKCGKVRSGMDGGLPAFNGEQ